MQAVAQGVSPSTIPDAVDDASFCMCALPRSKPQTKYRELKKRKSQTTTHKPQPTNHNPQTTTHNPQATNHNPPPTNHNPQPRTHKLLTSFA